jgi:uncharacterized protein YjbJ (UPF0337 family)
MNWDVIKGNWNQLKGNAREQWGKFTDDDLEVIAGKRDQLVGKLQERYGYAREDAERYADDFANRYNETRTEGRLPEVRTGGRALDGTPDTRGITEKIADAVTGDRIDDKTGKVVR